MKICLINAYPLKEMGIVGQIYPPLGILYLAAYVRSKFDNLDFLVLDGYKTGAKKLFELVSDFQPEVVGISCTTPTSTGAYEIANSIKKNLPPSSIIILGGPHPSINAEEPLSRCACDFVVRGEGENVFAEIISCIEKKEIEKIKTIPGISYKKEGAVINNPLMPLIGNLDELPFPARDLIDIKEYPGYHYKKRPFDTSLVSTRGCPFNCLYCSNPVWKLQKPWYRTRSPRNVVDEMEFIIKKYGISEFYDQTDEFNGNKQWAKSVCDEIINRKIDISWKVQMRSDNIDDELAKKMARAGCWLGFFGIETGNEETSFGINKNITLEQSINALKLLKQNGIKTFALLMAFNVWEDKNMNLQFEDREKTLNTLNFAKYLIKNNLLDLISWSLTTPYPGSRLFNLALKHNLIPKEMIGKWENWDSSANFIMRLPGVKNDDWKKIQRKGKLLQVYLLFKSGSFNLRSLSIYFSKIKSLLKSKK